MTLVYGNPIEPRRKGVRSIPITTYTVRAGAIRKAMIRTESDGELGGHGDRPAH